MSGTPDNEQLRQPEAASCGPRAGAKAAEFDSPRLLLRPLLVLGVGVFAVVLVKLLVG